jgi:hypothetical protein
MTEAYPLQWPAGRPRANYQERSRFKTTIGKATRDLMHEIRLMGAVAPVLSTNMRLRNDGLPYSNQRQPDDRGVAVYFTHKKRQMCFACDRWDKIEDNIDAIAKTVAALRGIERWGSGSMVEQAFTGFVALPPPASAKSPYEVLGVSPGATDEEVDAAYRQKAKAAHPDAGGSDSAMHELNEARRKVKERAA